MDPLSAGISAGANLLSGLMSSSSTSAINAANLAFAQQNLDFQKSAAKTGLQWRADDATAAQNATGINRLALLGVTPFSPSPVSAGQVPNTGLAEGVGKMGQDVARAAEAMSASNVRKAQLQEDLLKAQIANTNSETVKNQAAASGMATKATAAAPGVGPLYQQFRAPDGSIVTLPSEKASQALQNIAAWPSNLAIGGHMLARNMGIPDMVDQAKAWIKSLGTPAVRGDVWRNAMPVYQPGG